MAECGDVTVRRYPVMVNSVQCDRLTVVLLYIDNIIGQQNGARCQYSSPEIWS